MQYKAFIFDIDGTLLPYGQAQPAQDVQDAIINAQKNGVKIIIATGRAGFSAKAIIGKITPDYYVVANGALITNATNAIFSEKRFVREEMYALCDYCDNYSLPLAFTFDDGYYLYCESEAFLQEYGDLAGFEDFAKLGEDRDRHLLNMPYGACLRANKEQVAEFSQKYAHLNLRLVPFGKNGFHDVFSADINKAVAVHSILTSLGINMHDAVAFGDGHNDIELARAVGTSVCVGTGCKELTQIAKIHTNISVLSPVINFLQLQNG